MITPEPLMSCRKVGLDAGAGLTTPAARATQRELDRPSG